jgi:hypothetical protein
VRRLTARYREDPMTHETEFTVLPEHLTLLCRAYVSWNNCEYGAPEINPKRPYGNSDVEHDIAKIFGWKLFEDADGDTHFTAAQRDEAQRLHRGTERALEIVLRTCQFRPGTYRRSDWCSDDWTLIEDPAE